MSQQAAAPAADPAIPTIPLRHLAPWIIFIGLLALIVLFFVTANQGAVSIPSGVAIHEWVHDGRHVLGYPCH